MAAKIRKGDKVVVLAGRDKGKSGEVTLVFPTERRAVVAGAIGDVPDTRFSARGLVATEFWRGAAVAERAGFENRLYLWYTGVRIPPSPFCKLLSGYKLAVANNTARCLHERMGRSSFFYRTPSTRRRKMV